MNFMNEDSRGLAAWRDVLKKEYYHMDCAPTQGKVKVKRLWDPPTPREEVEVLEQVKNGIVAFCKKRAKANGGTLESTLGDVFRRVDKDHSGQLQRNEFISALKYDLGLALNEKQAHAVMQWLDKVRGVRVRVWVRVRVRGPSFFSFLSRHCAYSQPSGCRMGTDRLVFQNLSVK
jgi:hypothetical protein